MSIGSISSLLPLPAASHTQNAQSAQQKTPQQNPVQPRSADADGDNDGSSGASASPAPKTGINIIA